jgi:hypothetical protein
VLACVKVPPDFDGRACPLPSRGSNRHAAGRPSYKRLDEVLAEHGDSIRVLHRLTPIGVAMAGPDIYDPYKD